jgi:hypothetical protein
MYGFDKILEEEDVSVSSSPDISLYHELNNSKTKEKKLDDFNEIRINESEVFKGKEQEEINEIIPLETEVDEENGETETVALKKQNVKKKNKNKKKKKQIEKKEEIIDNIEDENNKETLNIKNDNMKNEDENNEIKNNIKQEVFDIENNPEFNKKLDNVDCIDKS